MPKKEPSDKSTPRSSNAGSTRKTRESKAKNDEIVLNFHPFDPGNETDDKPVINKRLQTGKKLASTSSNFISAESEITPSKLETDQLQIQVGGPPPRKSGSRAGSRNRSGENTRTGNKKQDSSYHIPSNSRQEIYGILLIVGALIFFFGLFAQKGLIFDAGLAVRRIFGLATYFIPFLVAFIGATFFAEGFLKREFINQIRLLGGILSIMAFVSLVHLFSDNPQALADSGGGGGYIGFFLTSLLSGLLQGIGAFLLLTGLFLVGLIIAFNISLRQLWLKLRDFTGSRGGLIQAKGSKRFDEANDEDDLSTLNPNLPLHSKSYYVNRDDNNLEDEPLLGEYETKGSVATPGGKQSFASEETAALPNFNRPPSITSQPVTPSIPPTSSQGAAGKNDRLPQILNWKREEQPGPAPVELPHKEWVLPPISMLPTFTGVEVNEKELLKKARKIEETLASFGVEAVVREVNTGPTVTQFALEPGFGVKVARITALANDLALALAAPAIRIEAPVPGQQRVGVEVPNQRIATVGLREIMEAEEFQKKSGKLKIALGRDVAGQPVVADLAKMPHLLIAGATGSGKSVCINSTIAAFLFQYSPDELKFIMVDPKLVELSTYNGIPHLAFPVVTQIEADPDKERERTQSGERIPTVMSVLKWSIREMEKRYKRLSLVGHRNIESYNKAAVTQNSWDKMPYLVLIIDELADLMMVAPEEAESSICRLAQKARAVGIHLILATQRPSVDVVTGLIKANFPSRITFAVTSQADSRVILDMGGAEKLLGRGDMLYMPNDAAKPQRIQGVFVGDEEIDNLVNFWIKQESLLETEQKEPAQTKAWSQELNEIEAERSTDEDDTDELFEQALQVVRESRTASVSLLQRRLRIGYNRAAVLIDQLERTGVIGHAEGSKPRRVLLEEEDLLEPLSLTAAANAFIPMPDKAEFVLPELPANSRTKIVPPNNSVKHVTPALNSQAKLNERRTEQAGEDFDDDPPL